MCVSRPVCCLYENLAAFYYFYDMLIRPRVLNLFAGICITSC